MNKINSSGSHTVNVNRSWERLEHVAGVHYPRFLWRTLPIGVKNALRALRARIISSYIVRQLPRNKEFIQPPEDAIASASLSIIVPVHDAPEVTRRCLMSLQKYAPQAEIILVDDGSKLEETQKLLEDFSRRNRWKLIRHPEALRHSAACGAGAGLATRPYLCLLNSDTMVTPWCWRPIVQAFENNPKIGVAGPSTSYSPNSQTMPVAYCARHSLNDSQICEYARRLLTECSNAVLTDVPWVCGFAFFIRRSLWRQLGGFDRNIPDYLNEGELCIRVLQDGYRVVWTRNSYIHHLGGTSYSTALGRESIHEHVQQADNYIKQKYGHVSGQLRQQAMQTSTVSTVKSLIHRALHNIGFDLIRYDASHSEDVRFRDMLSAHQVNLIFDVGANIGQFGWYLRQIGYKGRIASFEPLSTAWAQLQSTSASDPMWEVAPRCAIGSEDGEIEIHVAGNSFSSSALNMLDSHLNAAPGSRYVGAERVPLRCLNTIGLDYLHPDSVLFVKIDTQGFEGPVLQGATEILKIAVGLHVELSLVPLYENQRLFDSLICELQSVGFEIWSLVPGFHDPRSGRLLQIDAIFFRRQN